MHNRRRTFGSYARLLYTTSVIAATVVACGASPDFQFIWQFDVAPGCCPAAPVTMGAGGVLYGTTQFAIASWGTVFSLAPPSGSGGSWTQTTLYSFSGGDDGASPASRLLIGGTGVLYGATEGGGTSGLGVVFSLTPPASAGSSWVESVLYNFNGTDGANPVGNLVAGPGGVLYGLTYAGGTYGLGTAFSLTPPGREAPSGPWTGKVLHNFGAPGDAALNDRTWGGLTAGSNDVLYGLAGGGAFGQGAVFSLTPPAETGGAWAESVLYSFSGPDGASVPDFSGGMAVGAGGVLYGATNAGGASGDGVVFSLTPPSSPGGAWTESVLYNFTPESGERPASGLTLTQSGTMYGTTNLGGGNGPYFRAGTVYRITPPAAPGEPWTYTVLHVFNANGYPMADLVIGGEHTLYGTTFGAYPNPDGDGSVFSLTF
jgi:uncharacterized repeat protein (TIGR03803 family)